MDKLYELMDWAAVEAVVYAEEDHPSQTLGAKVTSKGVLIQAFFPGEQDVSVRVLPGKKTYPMVKQDEEGFFALLLRGKKIPDYEYVTGGRPEGKTYRDPYNFPGQITEKEQARFSAGIWYDSYRKLGAHPMEINGVAGVYFAVWAPNAMRVSVVGDFNSWDGRVYPMNRLDCGIFELFIPGIEADAIYKYELKARSGIVYLKSDPYGNAFEEGEGDASKITVDGGYHWHDQTWLAEQKKNREELDQQAMIVYQTSLQTWAKKIADEGQEAVSYQDLAREIAAYAKDMGYTHVELTPVMEYPDDRSQGFEVSGYFAPTARYGDPAGFLYLVDLLHKNGIGLILDYVACYFASGYSLLTEYDGSKLYEDPNPARGIHPAYGTHMFNYGKPEVADFLISSMKFWAKEYHVDGFKVTDLATMLYLDFGREFDQWEPNMYGESQNLEARDFIKKMNQVLESETAAFTVAEEMAGGWHVTGPAEEEIGLGFNLKWNHEWSADFLDYMRMDPIYRGPHQEELALSTVAAFQEKYMIGFGKDDLTGPAGDIFAQMPDAGPEAEAADDLRVKLANTRLAYAYAIAHPGKKLFYGVEKLMPNAEEAPAEDPALAKSYIKDLFRLYKEYPALYQLDTKEDGFEWISNLDAERNLLIFLRKADQKEESLLFVCNFSNVAYEDFPVGLPAAGKYKEIFNTDAEKYGGSGLTNPHVKISKAAEAHERQNSIMIEVAPLSMSVFRLAETKERTTNKDARAAKKQDAQEAISEKEEVLIELTEENADPRPVEEAKKEGRKSVRQTVSQVAERAGKTAGQVAERAGKTADDLRERAGKAADEAASLAGKTADDLRERAGKAADEAASRAGKTADDLRERAEKAADEAASRAGKTADDLREKAGKTAEDIRERAEKAAADLTARVPGRRSK